MIKKSKQHLNSVNESYSEHMVVATKVSFIMLIGGLMALIHGFIPALFEKSASDKIKKLYNYINQKR
ncbi:DUF6356 family protein [Candidatus Pelagibacter sp. HIMB1623]|uniref:DUF6356 family protein n=1 Tax=unclassified Candidatus Pelagibacter TaxID=2647897 RepID=UPI003F832BC0